MGLLNEKKKKKFFFSNLFQLLLNFKCILIKTMNIHNLLKECVKIQ